MDKSCEPPAQSLEPRDDARTIRRVLKMFGRYRKQVALSVTVILASAALNIANAFIVRVIFDEAIAGKDFTKLLYFTALMFGFALVGCLLGFAQSWVNLYIGQNLTRDLRNRLFDHLQKMPVRFYINTRSGDIYSRIGNDVDGLQGIFTNTLPLIVGNLAIVAGSIGAMFYISPLLTLLSMGLLPACFIAIYRFGRARRLINQERQEAYASLSTFIFETFGVSGYLLVKTFGGQERSRQEYDNHTRALFDLEKRQQIASRVTSIVVTAVLAALPAIVYLIGGWQLIRGNGMMDPTMTAGTIVAFTSLQLRFFSPATQLINVQADVQAALVHFDRIFEYLDLPVEILDKASPIVLQRQQLKGEVTFRNVTFSYNTASYLPAKPEASQLNRIEQGPAALRDVSFVIPPGKIAALVGPSGAGKSTIVQLIARLYDVSSGSVELDGHDVRDIKHASLMESIGFVAQETFLFHKTIRENILYGCPEATDAELHDVAKAAALHDRIMQLEHGYDTIVGDRGYKLSGGERQRLAIARALLSNPRILILDEATSALDLRAERLLQEATDRLLAGRTAIVVAHRLSTITKADIIFVVDKGTISERGTHEELLELRGLYAELYRELLLSA